MAKRLKRERRLGEKRSETETKKLINAKRFRNKFDQIKWIFGVFCLPSRS